jgi:hypothetical protein
VLTDWFLKCSKCPAWMARNEYLMQFRMILVFNVFSSWSQIPVTGGSSEWILWRLEGCEGFTNFSMGHCRVTGIPAWCCEYEICEFIIWVEFTFQTQTTSKLTEKHQTEYRARICRVLHRSEWGVLSKENYASVRTEQFHLETSPHSL